MKRTEANERFNLTMPQELRRELEQVAEEHQTTPTNAIRKFMKLGLTAEKAKKRGGGLYLRKDRDSKLQEIDIFGL
jgi:metal-responsive CopG/Arc/MetJ family transcriptional regulator